MSFAKETVILYKLFYVYSFVSIILPYQQHKSTHFYFVSANSSLRLSSCKLCFSEFKNGNSSLLSRQIGCSKDK